VHLDQTTPTLVGLRHLRMPPLHPQTCFPKLVWTRFSWEIHEKVWETRHDPPHNPDLDCTGHGWSHWPLRILVNLEGVVQVMVPRVYCDALSFMAVLPQLPAHTGQLGLVATPKQASCACLDSFSMWKSVGDALWLVHVIMAWTALNGVYLGCPKLHVFKCMVSWASYNSSSYRGGWWSQLVMPTLAGWGRLPLLHPQQACYALIGLVFHEQKVWATCYGWSHNYGLDSTKWGLSWMPEAACLQVHGSLS
jgi:hypothetical protein